MITKDNAYEIYHHQYETLWEYIFNELNFDTKIFNLKEDIRLLNSKYELVLLDHNFLSSPKKLDEYQKKYFENDLIPTNIKNIKEINFQNKKIIINETAKTLGEKVEKQ